MRIQVLEKEDRTLNERIRSLNEAIDGRSMNIDKTNGKLDTVVRECDQVKSAVQALDYQVGDLQRVNAQSLELQKRLIRQKDNEAVKGSDLDNGARMGE